MEKKKTYGVEIFYTTSCYIEVEATDEDEAIDIACDMAGGKEYDEALLHNCKYDFSEVAEIK